MKSMKSMKNLDAQQLVDLKPEDVEMLAGDTCLWPRPAPQLCVHKRARLVQGEKKSASKNFCSIIVHVNVFSVRLT